MLPIDKDRYKLFKDGLQAYHEQNRDRMIARDVVKPSTQFLDWLVGFTEGDGCFTLNRKGKYAYCSFVLTQGYKNRRVLFVVRDMLGFGHLLPQGKRTYRFVVYKKDEIQLLIALFNGNLVLPSRKKQFNSWFQHFFRKRKRLTTDTSLLEKQRDKTSTEETANQDESHAVTSKAGLQTVLYKNENRLPSLHDLWLLGFVEAEGCFTISFLKNSNAFRVRFIVSQKGDINLPQLSHLVLLFLAGRVEAHSIKDNFSYICSGLKNVQNVFGYFDSNLQHFQGIKRDSYQQWKLLIGKILEKQHLNPTDRAGMVDLARQINQVDRKNR